MTRPLAFWVCRTCGRPAFPRRALCPACGGHSWRHEHAEHGVVEEVTTVHHADGTAVVLASVRLDAGPVVVSRLDGAAAPGARVALVAVDGAPVARLRER